MIVVIADDLTGAGEIGGIGLAYGLKAEIQRPFCSESDAELLIIDTDTRSLSSPEAGQAIRGIARRLNKSGLPIEWIYKKTDSVLRGPVASELEALREVMRVARVLVVPANPSKGRIVCNGKYLIHGKLLSETDFVNDPEYPATTSNVLEMPGLSDSGQIHYLKSDQTFSGEGIVFGQAETTDDLLRWSEQMDEQTIPAGAGEFFEAILRNKGFSKKMAAEEKEYRLENKILFVCGSSSDSSRQALRKAESLGMRVCRMPEGLFRSEDPGNKLFQQWSDQIAGCFENSRCVIIAIDREVVRNVAFAGKLRRSMAKMAWTVFQTIPLKELFVEGGATASEIAGRFGWNRFEPCDQLGPGVVRMKVLESDNIYLTIKPGSYVWPEGILNLISKGFRRAQ
jgi:uncharacterized protein YgbK (DUF1537 family)